ncbi:MAG: hypothetical protein HBSIN02_07800 [Bacteroidia bacterium]|nr:MAG: hypothetical protein HBSIN02_07800 [Bacteroidia bacterium]
MFYAIAANTLSPHEEEDLVIAIARFSSAFAIVPQFFMIPRPVTFPPNPRRADAGAEVL